MCILFYKDIDLIHVPVFCEIDDLAVEMGRN